MPQGGSSRRGYELLKARRSQARTERFRLFAFFLSGFVRAAFITGFWGDLFAFVGSVAP
jgi:hypothetical protein